MFYISDNEEYFTYTEWSSKANPGGLTRKKVKPKVVTVYKNENSVRCPVRLLKFYMEATQMNSNMVDKAFYLKPTDKSFANVPLGQHTIEAYHKSIYEDAGLSGYYTLHGENLLFLSLYLKWWEFVFFCHYNTILNIACYFEFQGCVELVLQDYFNVEIPRVR